MLHVYSGQGETDKQDAVREPAASQAGVPAPRSRASWLASTAGTALTVVGAVHTAPTVSLAVIWLAAMVLAAWLALVIVVVAPAVWSRVESRRRAALEVLQLILGSFRRYPR